MYHDQRKVRITVTVERGDRVGVARRSSTIERMVWPSDEPTFARTREWVEAEAGRIFDAASRELSGREAR